LGIGNDKSVETGYVGGQNRCGGVKEGIRGIFESIFQVQMREGAALRQQICVIPGRESRKTLRIESEEGRAILLARRPTEQQCS